MSSSLQGRALTSSGVAKEVVTFWATKFEKATFSEYQVAQKVDSWVTNLGCPDGAQQNKIPSYGESQVAQQVERFRGQLLWVTQKVVGFLDNPTETISSLLSEYLPIKYFLGNCLGLHFPGNQHNSSGRLPRSFLQTFSCSCKLWTGLPCNFLQLCNVVWFQH